MRHSSLKTKYDDNDKFIALFPDLHITGLAISGGLSLANYLSQRKYWKVAVADRCQVAMTSLPPRIPALFWVGVVLLVLSGGMMMHLAFSAFMSQSWFHIKLGLLLLIILNAVVINRLVRLFGKTHRSEHVSLSMQKERIRLKRTVTFLSFIQLVFFALIFVLAVFRFN